MTVLPCVHFDELELVVSDDQYMFWKGQPFTGIAVEFFPDGTLQSEVPHVNGIRHGLVRAWHPSGQLRKESNLWYGGLHGYRREWDEQGHLVAEVLGELGIAIAEKRWDEQGRLIKDWHISPTDNLYSTLQICRKKWGQSAPPL
ncbi:toxin-antitoxin system YwqK family antitoxin [Vitiosangium sp. GDMCC 1.1324]|uniref:toxin-antitoxin system YwqK family antitoxin n=1 Tax=Vitiosangium sp. (strain GDMCC 1.1324) TaxID=2138576 RepID=UPI00130D983B|nr:hypothetical protein [Vitiosangium sp. GDMCC 1.1324]